MRPDRFGRGAGRRRGSPFDRTDERLRRLAGGFDVDDAGIPLGLVADQPLARLQPGLVGAGEPGGEVHRHDTGRSVGDQAAVDGGEFGR